jgi:hypothetical protein
MPVPVRLSDVSQEATVGQPFPEERMHSLSIVPLSARHWEHDATLRIAAGVSSGTSPINPTMAA